MRDIDVALAELVASEVALAEAREAVKIAREAVKIAREAVKIARDAEVDAWITVRSDGESAIRASRAVLIAENITCLAVQAEKAAASDAERAREALAFHEAAQSPDVAS